MDSLRFAKFLVAAKKASYAEKRNYPVILEDQSKELVFEANSLRYRDRYFGLNPFVGEEVVFENGKPIWAMNYFGTVLQKDLSPESVYTFLRGPLKSAEPERPYRGPRSYTAGEYEYRDHSEGKLDFFIGMEHIRFRGQVIYKLNYHGGLLDKLS